MSSFSRGGYSRRFRGSGSGRRRRGGLGGLGGMLGGRRFGGGSPLRRILGRRSGMGCAVFVGAFLSLGTTVAGLAWWIL